MDADDVAVLRPVVLDERCRLPVVQREAPLDRLERVVGAALDLGALEHPVDQLLPVADLELEDDVDRALELAQQHVERLSLRHRAREAVEDEARDRVAAREPVADQVDHQLVVDELAGVEHRLQLAAERRLELAHLAQHVAGRDVRDAVGGRDLLRLRPLATPLRSQDDDVHD